MTELVFFSIDRVGGSEAAEEYPKGTGNESVLSESDRGGKKEVAGLDEADKENPFEAGEID